MNKIMKNKKKFKKLMTNWDWTDNQLEKINLLLKNNYDKNK